MLGFIIRRVLWTIPVVILATFLTFSLVKLLPYDQNAFSSNPKYTDEQVAALEHQYGLDQSFMQQYGTFLKGLATGDLGISTQGDGVPVSEAIKEKLPVSMTLGACAFLVASLLGTSLGMISALKANRTPDYAITLVSTFVFALPSFVVATLWVKYIPYYGWDTWVDRIGPITVLALSILPYFVRLVRASMLEALQQEYVLTAQAKGLPWRRTVVRHTMRNSMIPTVVNAGPLFGFLLTGSFVIEYIMVVPGIASEFVDSFNQPLDLQMILVTTVLLSVIIILMNLVVDIVVGWLDPRITHD